MTHHQETTTKKPQWDINIKLPHLPGAVCTTRDPQIWDDKTGNIGLAKQYCAACPARRDCLQWALNQEKLEPPNRRACVWGGHTPQERTRLARGRQLCNPITNRDPNLPQTLTRPNGTPYTPRHIRLIYAAPTRKSDGRIIITGTHDTTTAQDTITRALANNDHPSYIPREALQTALQQPPLTGWLEIQNTKTGCRAFSQARGAASVYYWIPGTKGTNTTGQLP